MAQLVERRVRNAEATSSNLVISTKNNPKPIIGFGLFLSKPHGLACNHGVAVYVIVKAKPLRM